MTITQLEYVVALDKYRNFRRAAESCFVTQPTLSTQLQKLEEQLGEVLFNRQTSPIQPTDIGEKVIRQARVVLAEAQVINEIVGFERGELKGTLRIGIIPTILTYLLPLFLDSLYHSCPDLVLEVSEMTTPDCLKALDREDIDVAILATKEDRKKYEQESLYREEMLLYINSDHFLFEKKNIKPTELEAKDLWVLEEGHCLRDEVLKVCRIRAESSKRPGNLRFKMGSLESLRYLVQESHGYTLLPYMATLKLSSKEIKHLKSFAAPRPSREINLTKNRHRLKARAIEALKVEILKNLPEGIEKEKSS